MNYYFAATALPPLSLDADPNLRSVPAFVPQASSLSPHLSPGFSVEELFFFLRLNLTAKDFREISTLRLREDLFNIRALYQKQPLSTRGNFNEKELEEALLVETDLPSYVFEFLGQFEQNSEKLRHFNGLVSTYYNEEISSSSHGKALKELLSLQKNIRLVLTALRAKKEKKNLLKELAFENFSDPLVEHILDQKETENYDPPQEFQKLKEDLERFSNNPWQQYNIILKFEFNALEELLSTRLFSFDYILGYTARYLLLEEHKNLSSEKGKEILNHYRTRTTNQYGVHP